MPVRADASAGPGILKSRASVSQGFCGSAFSDSVADASSTDNLTFGPHDPGVTGSGAIGDPGRVTFNPSVLTGSEAVSGPGDTGSAEAYALLTIRTPRFSSRDHVFTINLDDTTSTGMSGSNTLTLPSFEFVFGRTYQITYTLHTYAAAVNHNPDGGAFAADADFSRTFLWPGISSVVDLAWIPTPPDWQVTSDSGFNYANAAVKPAAAAVPNLIMLLAALGFFCPIALRQRNSRLLPGPV